MATLAPAGPAGALPRRLPATEHTGAADGGEARDSGGETRETGGEGSEATDELDHPRLVLRRGPGGERRLRGDWEAPSALLVAYADAWPELLARVVREAAASVPVYLLVDEEFEVEEVAEWMDLWDIPGRVQVLLVDVDTPWVRDYGPLQAEGPGGRHVWLDPVYDDSRPADDRLPGWLAPAFDVDLAPIGVLLDGGGVSSNGAGLCAVTWKTFAGLRLIEEGADRADEVMARLGCRVFAVLPNLPGEETGHADLFVQFFSRESVGVARVDADRFPDLGARLDRAAAALHGAAALLGGRLRVHRVPMPIDDGVFYSYLNAVRVGDRLLVPSFARVERDVEREAHAILRRAGGLPLVPVPTEDAMDLGGGVHCLSLGLFHPAPDSDPPRLAMRVHKQSKRRGPRRGRRPRAW